MTGIFVRREHDKIDLSADRLWNGPADERDALLTQLRHERPVSWQRPIRSPLMNLLGQEDPPGYWAVVRHEDIVTISRHADAFSSAIGGVTFEELPSEVLEVSSSILAMDAPRHGKIRRIVSSVFTPRRLRLIGSQIVNQARLIVDDIVQYHDGAEFVGRVAARLPMWTVSEMVGIPDDMREEVTGHANAVIGWDDDENTAGAEPLTAMFNGITSLHDSCQKIIDARRQRPEDDLISALIQAEVDGHRLTDEEIKAFFTLLCIAGNDTTKQTTTHTVRALSMHPDQRAYLLEDFDSRIDTAIEEFLRWASPVMTFRRTALRPFELSGVTIEPGDKVVMFYNSANRDSSVFADPGRFDLSRKPNPHLAFGGGGPHFCLGSHVAKLQLRAITGELYRRLPDIEAVGEPEYLTSTFINGIKRQYVRFTPKSE
ncbi:cytochrome [Mycobacterium florentinum]|uniref:Cytochrome n=1 Tax=Mycobacterium florentinum TaxID=292462 RepID=A0A1X1UC37_MYCFL|nr:cytochrome P450 [Mycobacterium florentinum]MCV7412356.1 cytochrome P450 [Mycobacterium florentinum]ORV54346.1 cytochrome [Mycobacterium florentinum]BBX81736.1 cytochrome P450 [Mycobacterium florentinum]